MENTTYYYSLYKNKVKIGEKIITIEESDIKEQIYIELSIMGGKKNVLYFDVINEKIVNYYKNTYEGGFFKYSEELKLIKEREYLIKKLNLESKAIFSEEISIYEKELFVPKNRIDSLMYNKLIISLEAMKTYRIRYALMKRGEYKLFVPENIMLKYNKENICIYYKNIENGVEIINEC